MTRLSRREFVSLAATMPFAPTLSRWLPCGDDRCLVVVELVGGNDGLNTLIPLDDDAYARARPNLGKVRGAAIELEPGWGLHESLAGIAALVAGDSCAVVHGVGYPDPDRSHFRSRDIWHAADPTLDRERVTTSGWLGRAADWLAARGAEVPALGLGSLELPLALRGTDVTPPVLRRIEDYTLLVAPDGDGGARREALTELVEAAGGEDELTAFVRGVARSGVEEAARLERALARYRAHAEYPDGGFGEALQLTARVLVSGFGTRICHVPLDGFDTHANQAPTHAGLLRQLSLGLAALCDDLRGHAALDRTAILVHSEFGRRVAENRSQGTDHGAAAPVLVCGGGVRPGLHGEPPSLATLDDGDLIATTDFRSVYGALLERLGVPRARVLGDGAPAPFALFT